MRLLKPGGRALIYVWAFEQEYNKLRSKYLKDQTKEHPENHGLTNSASEHSREARGKSSIHTSRHLEDKHRTVGSIQELSKETDCKLSVHTNRTAFNTQDLLVPWHLKEGKRQGKEELGESVKKDKRKTSGNSSSAYSLSSKDKPDCNPDPSSGLDPDMASGPNQDTGDSTHSPYSKPQLSADTTSTSTSALQSESEGSSLPVFHRYYHVFQQGELEQLCGQVTGVTVQSSYHDQGNWCVILEKMD